MALKRLEIATSGESFYPISNEIADIVSSQNISHGIVHLFCMHTSCSLTISEAFDPSAKDDLEKFLKYLAPRNLDFITHDAEGPDDSPSHMKSLLTSQSLSIPLENGIMCLGTWQGIYLCEFRDEPKTRTILVKTMSD